MIMKQINKSLTFMAALALAFAALAVSGCYKDGTDHMSSDVRISLFPAPSDFAADGTSIDGAEEFSASVVVNRGAAVSGGLPRFLNLPTGLCLQRLTLRRHIRTHGEPECMSIRKRG